jgi:hypothetical protein
LSPYKRCLQDGRLLMRQKVKFSLCLTKRCNMKLDV